MKDASLSTLSDLPNRASSFSLKSFSVKKEKDVCISDTAELKPFNMRSKMERVSL